MLGQLYISYKRYQEAEMKFLELNRLDPYNSEYLIILGDLAKLQYKWNDAIDHYLSAFDINQNVIEPVEQALQISLNAELFFRAEEICNILLEDNPRNEKYWETYRDLTLFNKHYEKSFKAIEMLESLNVWPAAGQTVVGKPCKNTKLRCFSLSTLASQL